MNLDTVDAEIEAAAGAKDWSKAWGLAFEAALAIHGNDKDPSHYQLYASVLRAKRLLSESPADIVPRYRVSSVDDDDTCAACKAVNGSVVERAAVANGDLPVPVKGCRGRWNGVAGFCRCALEAVLDF